MPGHQRQNKRAYSGHTGRTLIPVDRATLFTLLDTILRDWEPSQVALECRESVWQLLTWLKDDRRWAWKPPHLTAIQEPEPKPLVTLTHRFAPGLVLDIRTATIVQTSGTPNEIAAALRSWTELRRRHRVYRNVEQTWISLAGELRHGPPRPTIVSTD